MSGTTGPARDGDRPTKYGAMLGEVLALMAELGRRDAPMEIPDTCLTCAFRRGTMPNQSAGTGKVALDCVLGIDRDRFACHHGMKDGEPQKICVGYVAAMLAPFSQVKELLAAFHAELCPATSSSIPSWGADQPASRRSSAAGNSSVARSTPDTLIPRASGWRRRHPTYLCASKKHRGK